MYAVFLCGVCGVGLVTGALEPQFNIVLTMVYYAGGKGKADIVSSATVPVNSMDTLLEVWCRVFASSLSNSPCVCVLHIAWSLLTCSQSGTCMADAT